MPVPSSSVLREEVLVQYAEVKPMKFRSILRLTPVQFDLLIQLIEGNDVFKSKNPLKPQAPVRTQLIVALYRLGTKGISVEKVALTFGVGQGTVSLYTRRCVKAICCLEDLFIYWPGPERKLEIKEWFRKVKGFPQTIGAVDGVHFPLESAPSLSTKEWNTRKCVYAMGCTAVCDHQGRFIYVSTGYIGSMNDSQAYSMTQLSTKKEDFFQGLEFILGDAGYANTPTVITRFKGNDANDPQRAAFNNIHGSARVKIEHAFGWLKLKWQSLQNLPIKIASVEDMYRAADWVIACMILHNFCLMHPDGGEVADVEENWNQYSLHVVDPIVQTEQQDEACEGTGPEQNDRRDGKAKREEIFAYVMKNKDIVRANRNSRR